MFGQHGISSAISSVPILSPEVAAEVGACIVIAMAERAIGVAIRPQTAKTLKTRNMVSLMLTGLNLSHLGKC